MSDVSSNQHFSCKAGYNLDEAILKPRGQSFPGVPRHQFHGDFRSSQPRWQDSAEHRPTLLRFDLNSWMSLLTVGFC